MSGGALRQSTVVVAADELLSGEFEAEAVVLDLRNGVYYGLEGTGARIWQLLKEPRAVAAVRDTLVAEYDVEPDRCTEDLHALLQDLLARGLIRIVSDDG